MPHTESGNHIAIYRKIDHNREAVMGKMHRTFYLISIILMLSGCTQKLPDYEKLKHFPLDSMDGILTKSGLTIDREISSDGRVSIKATALQSSVFRLFELNDIDVENSRLTYRARLRTEAVEGQVYLEMRLGFPGRGEYFSRSLDSALNGSVDWTTVETPFLLQKGQNPDYVKLNLVIDGRGTAWIDDASLLKGPLK
jgi:hypothetical protein